MKIYKILSAETDMTTASEGREPEAYYRCTVTIDNTLREKELEQLYGRKVIASKGGNSLNYAVLKSDAAYSIVEEFVKGKAEGADVLALIEGDAHEMQTEDEFYVTDRKGTILKDENGNPRTNNVIRFFCPEGASALTQFRRITRKLKWVEKAKEAPTVDDAVLS